MVQQHMNLQQTLDNIKQQYEVLAVFDLNQWFDQPKNTAELWLSDQLKLLWKPVYDNNQRLVFTLTSGDHYENASAKIGIVLKELQFWLNRVDISNFFVIILTNEPEIDSVRNALQQISRDQVAVQIYEIDESCTEKKIIPKEKKIHYQYNSSDLVNMDMNKLSSREKFLLTESKTFCIYPWIHLHAFPTGEAYPCCNAEMGVGQIGNCRTTELKEIWNSTQQKQLRQDMLRETTNPTCGRCYEQEDAGFFSGRKSANKHHGHHIGRVHETKNNGHVERFEMTYWDIRFSNLCNLKCRSCGHIFSSQWYQDQVKLAGNKWKNENTVLNYAGRTETDIWEQLEPHLEYVEQIYFAGGEPLLMEEHYNILEELVKRKRFDVRLIYNTNFTHTELRGKSVFEYWKLFDSVAVGASLDDSGARGEYIRKGTNWAVVEQNRRNMLASCTKVDFYISPTLSIMNAWHLPDFHRYMIDQGFIQAQDLNINILQFPQHYRIDIAPADFKERLSEKYLDHIMWLQDKDPLNRATVGFESAIKFMMATDNTHLIDTFWRKTNELDNIRQENILEVIPELAALK